MRSITATVRRVYLPTATEAQEAMKAAERELAWTKETPVFDKALRRNMEEEKKEECRHLWLPATIVPTVSLTHVVASLYCAYCLKRREL